MNVICIPLKRNMKCGSKIGDVIRLPQKKSSSDFQETNDPPKFTHLYNTNRFLELEMGEPSRNVIEMIFRASLTNPSKCRRKIKKVIKVKNPLEILGKFETYRERVMISSSSSSSSCNENRHPRSIVDGNEVLQFYGTTIKCCSKKEQVSELCRDPSCRVCRIIESGFNTSYNKVNGIQVSRKSEKMSEEVHVGKKARKAVIICRTIAGSTSTSMDFESYSICLRNPAALLPCFIIVF